MSDESNDQSLRSSADWDDLDKALAQIEADPAARAAYEDAQQREDLLDALVAARGSVSQRKLAAIVGTTQSAVSDVERGRVDPRLSTLQRHARAVGHRLELTLVPTPPAGSASAAEGAGACGSVGEIPAADSGSDAAAVHRGAAPQDTLATEARHLIEDKSFGEVLAQLLTVGQIRGPQSPAELARRTGLAEPTIGHAIHQLQASGWLHQDAPTGDLAPRFWLREDRGLVAGASIGRDMVTAVLTNLRTTRVVTAHQQPLESTRPEDVVQVIASLVRRLGSAASAAQDVVGLGVSLAGLVEGHTGTVLFAPDLQSAQASWRGVPLQAELQAATQLRAVVANDASALAMHEYLRWGEDRNVAVVLLSRSGEGVGGGLVVNGAIPYGTGGVSGEIGHVVVDRAGRPCRCGSARGCLETMASAAAIVRQIDKQSSGAVRTLADASLLVRQLDEPATKVFQQAGRAIGQVLATTLAIVGVPRIAVYGPPELTDETTVPSAQVFLREVRRGVAQAPFEIKTDVVAETLEESSEPKAAAATAVHYFLASPKRWMPEIVNVRAELNAISERTPVAGG
jgi:predicted NBD/HSP70 family sugar kinase/DNA-binding XRE family transcriptional regulator